MVLSDWDLAGTGTLGTTGAEGATAVTGPAPQDTVPLRKVEREREAALDTYMPSTPSEKQQHRENKK